MSATPNHPTFNKPIRRCDGTFEELQADLRAGLQEWEAIKHLYEHID